jgi:hypothetical protein
MVVVFEYHVLFFNPGRRISDSFSLDSCYNVLIIVWYVHRF